MGRCVGRLPHHPGGPLSVCAGRLNRLGWPEAGLSIGRREWGVRACAATLGLGGGGCVLSAAVDESRLFCRVRSTVAQGDEG